MPPRTPPVVGLAVAHAGGIALSLGGAFPLPALLALLPAALLIPLSRRPVWLSALLISGVSGILAGAAADRAEMRDCRRHIPDGWAGVVEGRPISRSGDAGVIPFRVQAGLPGGCRGTVRLLIPRGWDRPAAGEALRIPVRWERRGGPTPPRAEWAGVARAQGAPETMGGEAQGRLPGFRSHLPDLRGHLLGLRGRIQERIAGLWGPQAPMVEALVLARREHLDRDLRQAFAVSGTAHLLAISGFHVGVVGALLLGLLRLAGAAPRPAAAGAALGCWVYVLGIGAPDAAVRAALLMTLLVGARARGGPVVPMGALASAFLLLLVVDPANLGSVGFQLSFAATGGLVALRDPLSAAVDGLWRRLRGRPLLRGRRLRGPGEGLLRGGTEGLVAGVAATIPTLPLLAWHFDRMSLVGIVSTLGLAPLVAAAIPGIGVALLLDGVAGAWGWGPESWGPGAFLAGGVGMLLILVEWGVRVSAELPGAAPWVSRRTLMAGGISAATVLAMLRFRFPGRVRRGVRMGTAMAAMAGAALVAPMVPALGPGGALEVHMVDVGQGDAFLLRLPSDRWLAVDAGPGGSGWDAGSGRVAPHLRRAGARRLEALILTHPHGDHVGGAPGLLRAIPVRGILDPSVPLPSQPWREVLELGRERGVWWWRAEPGLTMEMDGVRFTLLHPRYQELSRREVADWNDLSLVILVEYGEASILLTGDAYTWVEEAIVDQLPRRLNVLKVGHHGSRTSTGTRLLEATRPEVALIPVGWANRFGHPHGEVLERLQAAGTAVYRTDLDGSVKVLMFSDGRVQVQGEG